MSSERGHRSRRRFLQGFGTSAAAILAAGEVSAPATGVAGKNDEPSHSSQSSGKAWPKEPPPVRQEIDLTGRWLFQIDPWDEGLKLGFFSPDFPTQDWREVTIPRAFDDCAPGMYKYIGICWFCRQFEVPVAMQGRRVVVCFEGVNYHSSVWVNGKLTGQNEDPFLPFQFPIHDVLRYGEKNLLVVRVDNMRDPAQLPTFEGWQGQGGILREVKLAVGDFVRISHVGITAVPEEGKGRFTVAASVTNERVGQQTELSLRVQILNRTGQTVAESAAAPLAVKGRIETELAAEGVVPQAVAWSPENPTLYIACVHLLANGILVDQQQVRFGFRRIERKEEKLWLNGKPLFLMGFNRHEDSPRTGMAVDLENSRNDFQAIKSTGANFVRFCHYPHHTGELDLCDELGLLVLSEIPLNGWGVEGYPNAGGGWNPADVPAILGVAERMLRKMIRRDINHPSIILWSISNESMEAHPEINEGNNRLLQLGRQLDRTRLMTHVSMLWASKDERRYFEFDDVISINAYTSQGLRTGRRPGDYSWLDLSTQWWKTELARLEARYPRKPILITEFGYACIEGLNGSFGEDAQALAAEADFKGMTAPYVCGATLWCYAKHPWPPGGFDKSTFDISPYGYVSRDRKTRLKAFSVVTKMFRRRREILLKGETGGNV